MNKLSKMKRPKMNLTTHIILLILTTCMPKDKGYYTKVSVNKIKELLDKRHGIHVGRRWVIKCLKRLEDVGYTTRKNNYTKIAPGRIRQDPSLFTLTPAGRDYLKINGIF